MKQSKFSLADVLTLLAALAFGFVCFLGTNFHELGDTKQSIILAGLITLLLLGTALGAKILKRTDSHFKACFVCEVILLVLFTGLLALFSYLPFSHYFVVSEKKADIMNKLNTSITQAGNMFAAYEAYAENREKLYENKLRSVATAKNINPAEYAAYGFENNGIDDNKQIEHKMNTVHAELFPTNYSDTTPDKPGTKEIALDWLSRAKKNVTGWKPIGIVDVVNQVDTISTDWLHRLVDLSKKRQKGEQAEDFEYTLSFSDVKKDFTTLGAPTSRSIVLSILTWLLMLWSWLISGRSTKRPVKVKK